MFRHLSVKSFYSFGCGVASIESLCARVRELGFRELALTDINGLYGIGWFLKSCQENGLTPIIGAEVRHPSGRAVLLVYSRQGYSHLCHILSARHLDQAFALADAVLRWRDGLVVISDSFPFLEHIAKAGGRQDLYVELRPGRNRSEATAFSRKLNIPPLVTNDVHFLDPDDYDLHVKVTAIHHKKTLRTVPREELADTGAWLKSARQMAQEFSSHPEALANVETVARQCAGFKLEFDHAIFPKVAGPDGKTSGEVLRELTAAAARKKYAGSVEVMQRLERELEIIIRKGFADTFLVMRNIVQRSAYRCGRGSAAASLVSHLLDITDVDPISCDLYFGRFLNESRTDPPDIDMDFCRDERRAIIDSVFEQYGDGKVAMVANHNCMGMRQAIRRLAELEGLPQAEIALLTRFFSGWGGSIEAFTKTHPMFKGVKPSDKWPQIFKDAERLVGLPSHLSLHPGGIVVAADGIDHYIPRQRSRNGIIAIQTEKDQTEDVLKFVKFDILGNTSLCVIRDTLNAIRRRDGQEIDYRDWRRFAADAKIRELIIQAKTMACFHIESASFLQLLQKIGPGLNTAGPQRIFDVMVILSSIIRPASNANIHELLRRFYGGKFTYLHPKLEPILSETYGLFVYQEHVNLVAMELAGFSEVEGDRLRKALTGKKSNARIRALMAKYAEGCRRNNIPAKVIKETAAQILNFVNYSFLKAHSASYVILALACVYLKAHFPAPFMAARMSHPGGFWSFRAYLSECQRLGLKILMPDINASRVECIGEDDWVRIGLLRVKGVQEKTKKLIVAEREKCGRFESFQDFLQRVPVDDDETERLIMAGVFDRLEPKLTPGAMHYLYLYWKALGKPADFSEWYPRQWEQARRSCRPCTEAEKMRYELEAFGTLISKHPLERYKSAMAKLRRVMSKDLSKYVGKSVTVVGWPIASKEVTTKKGEPMEFWAFEDEVDVFHCVLFPQAYEKFCRVLVSAAPVVITGVVQQEYGAVTINVMNMSRL